MARLFTREGNAAKAREWMEYAVKKDPENAGTLLAVGQLLFEAGQFEAAQEHLEKALELEPDSLNAKLLSGLVARFLGQTAKAEEYFQDAHLQSPRNFGAANQLALVLIEQDDEVKQRRAVELAQLNQSQYTNIPEASATLGWVYLKLNQIDAATKALTDAFKQSGQLGPDALFYLANLYEMQGQNANAKQMLQQAISRTTPFAHRKDAENMLTKLKALDNAGETPPASAPEEQ
jgi:tetratricopeptide (TPR) repeat protein